MSLLSNSIPRAKDVRRFYDDPLGFLAQTRSRLGNLFVIHEAGPIFSRSSDCAGVVAVFGTANHRTVLNDIKLFGMPVSAAQHLALPQNLVNLNRGLHSMRGDQHSQHRRLLMRVLSEHNIGDQHTAISTGLEAFTKNWRVGQTIGLLGEMRELALQVSTRLLFGDQYGESSKLASLLQLFFQFRREAASPFNSTSKGLREDLIALGTSLDDALRQYIRWCRQYSSSSPNGILTRLATLEIEPEMRLTEDELVAHCNVLFMSSNEPIAVALTWVLLILSQLPDLRCALRQELDQASLTNAMTTSGQLAQLSLLDSVINESLRLLPPNALMVRVTTQPASLHDIPLPENCEIILCPFLAHRDAERFSHPNEFSPSRWLKIRPSPFEFSPFGAGSHSCVGGHLAICIIKTTLSLLMSRYEIILADDQEIDWRLHIMLTPRNEPFMTICVPNALPPKTGKLLGPVANLLELHVPGA
jgi:cytochrome P450